MINTIKMMKYWWLVILLICNSRSSIAQVNFCATANNAGNVSGTSCATAGFNQAVTTSGNLLAADRIAELQGATGCGVTAQDVHWERFTATTTSTTIDFNAISIAAQITIFSGTCGALTEIGCNSGLAGANLSVVVPTVIGSTYYVRIQATASNAVLNGNMCIYSTPPLGPTCNYTLVMNDSWGDGWNGAYINVYVNGVLFAGSPFTCTGSQTVSTLSIPDGATVYLDYFAGSFESEVSYSFVNPGNTVLFSDGPTPSTTNPVYGPNVLVCPGDEPCSPYIASVACGAKSTGTIGSYTNSAVPAPACGNYVGGDMWYTLTVPASGKVEILGKRVSTGVSDIAVAAYTSAACGAAKTLVGCDDNSGSNNMPKLNLTGLTAGSTLYIRVWEPGNDASGTFELEITDPNTLFCLVGNASMYNYPADTCIQVTPNLNSQKGCAWYQNTIDFSTNFDHTLEVYCGNNDGGADGLTFTFHNDPQGTLECGNDGQFLGAGGIQKAVVIEVDTWNNGGAQEMVQDHIAVWTSVSGEGSPIAGPVTATAGATNIEDGMIHILRITWNATTKQMQIYFDGSLRLTLTNDFVTNIFGSNNVFWGSTGSTGGASNQYYVCPPASLTTLPIKMSSFTAQCNGDNIKLLWTTAMELNNDYFTIERSSDAINFSTIDKIDGAGNSNENINYEFIDLNPLNGVNYYRIKQTDFNGEFSYSELKAMKCNSEIEFSIYPNPFEDQLKVIFSEEIKESIRISINDSFGRIVYDKIVKDISVLEIDLDDNLRAGTYVLKATFSNKQLIKKMVRLQ